MPDANKMTFTRAERARSKKLIGRLFNGNGTAAMAAFPVRLVFRVEEEINALPNIEHLDVHGEVKVMVSVSKRHFKHAVDRNRVKRQLREAYRKNKTLITSIIPPQCSLIMAMIWIDAKHYPSEEIEQRVVGLLQRIGEKMKWK